MKYKRIFIVIIISLFIGIGSSIFWQFYYDQKHSLKNLGFSIAGREKFFVEERFPRHFSDYEEEALFANGESGILQLTLISNLTRERAQEYARSQFSVFESMFDKRLPPYPELITNATGCADEFLPQKKETPIGNYYTAYAGNRFNFGICDQSIAKYKSGVGIFYCEKLRREVKLSYFIDKSENFDTIDALMNSFICLDK